MAPAFWPGEFHGLYSPWGHKELNMTEQLSLSLFTSHYYLLAITEAVKIANWFNLACHLHPTRCVFLGHFFEMMTQVLEASQYIPQLVQSPREKKKQTNQLSSQCSFHTLIWQSMISEIIEM